MQQDKWQDKATQTADNAQDKAAQLKQTAKETVGAATDEVKKVAGSVSEQAQQSFQDLRGEIKDQALNAAEQVKQQAGSKLDEQKHHAADRLAGVASALRQTGERLSDESEETVGHYAQNMADQVERFSSYLRDRDVNELLGEVQSFARRQPELFVAGTLAAGFLLGRFLKSSSQRRETERYGATNTGNYAQGNTYPRTGYQSMQSASGERQYGTQQRASNWQEEGDQWNNR